jgi:hypothetical protein
MEPPPAPIDIGYPERYIPPEMDVPLVRGLFYVAAVASSMRQWAKEHPVASAVITLGGILRGGYVPTPVAGPRFAAGKWLPHFEKHGSEFGYQNALQYLTGARALINRKGVETFTRKNGDLLFYDGATNEFAAMTRDGVIRTYFRPEARRVYWNRQTK